MDNNDAVDENLAMDMQHVFITLTTVGGMDGDKARALLQRIRNAAPQQQGYFGRDQAVATDSTSPPAMPPMVEQWLAEKLYKALPALAVPDRQKAVDHVAHVLANHKDTKAERQRVARLETAARQLLRDEYNGSTELHEPDDCVVCELRAALANEKEQPSPAQGDKSAASAEDVATS